MVAIDICSCWEGSVARRERYLENLIASRGYERSYVEENRFSLVVVSTLYPKPCVQQLHRPIDRVHAESVNLVYASTQAVLIQAMSDAWSALPLRPDWSEHTLSVASSACSLTARQVAAMLSKLERHGSHGNCFANRSTMLEPCVNAI